MNRVLSLLAFSLVAVAVQAQKTCERTKVAVLYDHTLQAVHLWNEPGLTISRGAGVAGVTAAVSLSYTKDAPNIYILHAHGCPTEIALR